MPACYARSPTLAHRNPCPPLAASPGSSSLPSPCFCRPRPANAESTRVTFVLVNDIYLMADTMMPDGQRRGGFARLAAVVKAERAKGGHVILAHGGDTISPSLMSGIDRGAHIIKLTNMVHPDVFVPGNHEFDFGKATFLQRMAEATFPLYAANLNGPDGRPLPGFKDRSIVTFDGVRIGVTGAAYDQTPVDIEPRGSEVPAIGRDHQDTGRSAASRGRGLHRWESRTSRARRAMPSWPAAPSISC